MRRSVSADRSVSASWAVIRSRSPGEARQRLFNLAGMVVGTEPKPVTAPFSVRYVPPGFVLTHAGLNAGTPGFSIEPGAAEIVLRHDSCYGHIRIADVTLVPRAEQEKIVEGFTLGRCGVAIGWANPFASL